MAGWWAAPEQEAPETDLPSLNLNHITGAAEPIFPKAKLKRWERGWGGTGEEGREGREESVLSPPRMFSFRRCEDTELVLHEADRVSCLFPLKGENCGGGVWWRGGGNLVLNPLSCCFSWCCRAEASFRKTPPSLRDRRETGMSSGGGEEVRAKMRSLCCVNKVLKGHALYKMH